MVKKWLEYAEGDLEGAQILFDNPRLDRSWQLVVFHCHEAVEKLLKMLIVKQGKEVKKIHDLRTLLKDTGIELSQDWITYINELNPHINIPRYPDVASRGPSFRYDQGVARHYLDKTREFFIWIKQNKLI